MSIWAAIQHALNSTLGTSAFKPLDKMLDAITSLIKARWGGTQTFTKDGVFTVPSNVTKIWVTACAGGQAGQYNTSSSTGTSSAYGGDGGDWIYRQPYAVTPGSEISITIGKGGTSHYEAGGSTIIGDLVTLSCPGVRGGLGGSLMYGSNGFSSGGLGYGGSNYNVAIGGGGGSLGRGGTSAKDGQGNGNLGGGGAGSTYGTYKGVYPGGDGIVIIEW